MWKRERGWKDYNGKMHLGHTTKVGLKEVDRIIDGAKFPSLSIPSSSSEIDWIMKGPKSQKLSAQSSASKDNNSKVDHISRMPDVVLQLIISFLTMREAVATTVLSTRWRDLWTTSLSCLDFDISNLMVYRYYPSNQFNNRMSDFTRWVDEVIMQLCIPSRLDAFRVSFIPDKDSASHIDRWIMSAVALGVTDLQLHFNCNGFSGTLYEFPAQHVASSLKYLQLKFCTFHLPPDFTGFTSLVSLTLSSVHLNQSLVDNILSKSPLLEFLYFQYCYYTDCATFKVTGPSLLLKHLHIDLNTYGIPEIEVHDINILSFELGAYVQKLSIKNAPKLARLVLKRIIPEEILSNVPQLETLFLPQPFENTSIVPEHVFNNLKRLVFIVNHDETDLLGVVYILEACHLLQKLELDMGIIEKRDKFHKETVKRLAALPESPHNTLKEIQIYGFEAYPEKIELAKYLLNNAVVLQKMEIYTTSRRYRWNGEWELIDDTVAISLKKVRKLLQTVARSSTKLELKGSLKL